MSCTINDMIVKECDQRMLEKRLRTDLASFCDRVFEKTFQNRRVSSPAPVTMDSPSGDIACNMNQHQMVSKMLIKSIRKNSPSKGLDRNDRSV